MSLNMGQWLSVPFIIGAITLIIWSIKKGGPAGIEVDNKKVADKKR